LPWIVEACDEYDVEFQSHTKNVKREISALVELLAAYGPDLHRPFCDTLKGSHFSNMKELRFSADNGVWRLAFAFDTERKAILLVAGDKSGIASALFYKRLIKKADTRFKAHLDRLRRKN